MHKNTRRFYIVLQAFWQAENENQLVFTTARMPQKSRKLRQNPGEPCAAAKSLASTPRPHTPTRSDRPDPFFPKSGGSFPQ
jgi:hypothetical protein